ncbi:unnamed protein product [Rotaria magnacalcarata]|uniref:diacylglycerol O-acyltransferase n=1 Tax=Rotaria magnacalcarata TaxID=392030 RepID=A0A819YMV3_9BILA|nr:unnamed protein product [Rotaria magnacalcarata]
MYIDRYTPVRGGRWSDRLRRLSIWSIVSNYFPIKLIKTEDLDPSRSYIFGYHSHGAATVGAGINFLTEATHFFNYVSWYFPCKNFSGKACLNWLKFGLKKRL